METDGPPDDRRRGERHPLLLRVEYRDRDRFVLDCTENLSEGGVFIRTDRPLDLGEHVGLVLSFPGLLAPTPIDGRVSWRRPAAPDQPAGVGVEAATPEGRAELARLARVIAAADAPLTRSYRVLLVEDNAHVLDLYQHVLKRLSRVEPGGLEVEVAMTGLEALQLTEERDFDLVISDLYMPVMSGASFLTALRADPKRAATPVLVVSAGGADARRLASEAGADAFLQKPVRLQDVLATVRSLLAIGER